MYLRLWNIELFRNFGAPSLHHHCLFSPIHPCRRVDFRAPTHRRLGELPRDHTILATCSLLLHCCTWHAFHPLSTTTHRRMYKMPHCNSKEFTWMLNLAMLLLVLIAGAQVCNDKSSSLQARHPRQWSLMHEIQVLASNSQFCMCLLL